MPSRDALQRMSAAEREGAFQTKPLPSRVAIVAAGPIANSILAIVVFALTFTFVGVNVTAPRVDELVPDGAAAKAGFQVGDLIVAIEVELTRHSPTCNASSAAAPTARLPSR